MKISNTAIANYYSNFESLLDLTVEDKELFIEFFNWLKTGEIWKRQASWYNSKSLKTITITYRNSNGIKSIDSYEEDLGWKLVQLKGYGWELVDLS